MSRLFPLIFVHADLTRFFVGFRAFLGGWESSGRGTQGFAPDFTFRGRSSMALTLLCRKVVAVKKKSYLCAEMP